METVNKLIKQPRTTKRYTISTESQQRQKDNNGASIQIKFIDANFQQ